MFMFRVSKATCDIIEVFGLFSSPQALAQFAVEILQLYSGDATQRQHLQTRATHCLSCAEAVVTLQINKVHERLQAVSGNCNILASASAGVCALPTEGSRICQL